MEQDTGIEFIGKVRRQGTYSYIMTLEKERLNYLGLEKGDKLRVRVIGIIKKLPNGVKKQEEESKKTREFKFDTQ